MFMPNVAAGCSKCPNEDLPRVWFLALANLGGFLLGFYWLLGSEVLFNKSSD
jgi:hypothetical protein